MVEPLVYQGTFLVSWVDLFLLIIRNEPFSDLTFLQFSALYKIHLPGMPAFIRWARSFLRKILRDLALIHVLNWFLSFESVVVDLKERFLFSRGCWLLRFKANDSGWRTTEHLHIEYRIPETTNTRRAWNLRNQGVEAHQWYWHQTTSRKKNMMWCETEKSTVTGIGFPWLKYNTKSKRKRANVFVQRNWCNYSCKKKQRSSFGILETGGKCFKRFFSQQLLEKAKHEGTYTRKMLLSNPLGTEGCLERKGSPFSQEASYMHRTFAHLK